MLIQKKKHSVLTILHNVLGCHGVCVHHQIRELPTELHGPSAATQPARHTLRTQGIVEPEHVPTSGHSYLLLTEPGAEPQCGSWFGTLSTTTPYPRGFSHHSVRITVSPHGLVSSIVKDLPSALTD